MSLTVCGVLTTVLSPPCVALIEKPPLSRNSSGTGSPRKSKIKGLSLPDPGNKPLKAGGQR
jgi:hypothetical protein